MASTPAAPPLPLLPTYRFRRQHLLPFSSNLSALRRLLPLSPISISPSSKTLNPLLFHRKPSELFASAAEQSSTDSSPSAKEMLTGLLGNLSLLSYFAKKREKEAVVIVQALGVLLTYVVIVQLAMAEAMPLPQFAVTSAVIASGLCGQLPELLWLAS